MILIILDQERNFPNHIRIYTKAMILIILDQEKNFPKSYKSYPHIHESDDINNTRSRKERNFENFSKLLNHIRIYTKVNTILIILDFPKLLNHTNHIYESNTNNIRSRKKLSEIVRIIFAYIRKRRY